MVKQAIRFNEPIPERIANRPNLIFGLELYYDAWFELDGEREVGWGLGHIPRSAIVDYARDLECSSDQQADMLYLVREMDNDYLMRQSKKKPKTGKKETESDGKADAPGPSQ